MIEVISTNYAISNSRAEWDADPSRADMGKLTSVLCYIPQLLQHLRRGTPVRE